MPSDRHAPWELPAPEDPGGSGLPRPSRKLVLGLLVVLLALVALRLARGSTSAATGGIVSRSCTTAAAGVQGSPVAGGSFTFEVTGPQSWTYLVWLDAASATVGPGDASTATPRVSGTTPIYVAQPLQLSDCTLTATQPLGSAAPGQHELEVFRVTGGVATRVATAAFVVVPAQGSGR